MSIGGGAWIPQKQVHYIKNQTLNGIKKMKLSFNDTTSVV